MQTAVQHDSSVSSHFSNANLSPVQAQVVAALAEGATVSGAARQADIHRTTIHHWIRNHAEFKAAAEQAQAEYASALSDEMRELSALALKTLRDVLERSDLSAAVRLKAALAVLNRPHFPKPGWHLPERIESPQEQQVPAGLAEFKADYDIVRMSEALEANGHKAEPAAIPRNSPCPCGSGQKYKRCCSRTLAA
jgi:transposase-like protein